MTEVEESICSGCRNSVPRDDDRPLEQRTPCPKCGSKNRVIPQGVAVAMHASTTTDAIVVRAWDGSSLTLFGVLYGIVVTALGVIIARSSTGWLILYAIASLVILAILPLFFGQLIIGAMRWLIERGKRVPPRPFGRRFRRTR